MPAWYCSGFGPSHLIRYEVRGPFASTFSIIPAVTGGPASVTTEVGVKAIAFLGVDGLSLNGIRVIGGKGGVFRPPAYRKRLRG